MIFHLSFHYKKMNRVEIFMNGGSYMRMYLDLENKQCLTIVLKLIINLGVVMFLHFYFINGWFDISCLLCFTNKTNIY